MIVCHCRVVSDREIRTAIASGAAGVCAVAETCGVGVRCGGCLPAVRELLSEHGLPTDEHLTARTLRSELVATRGFPDEACPARASA